MKWYFATLLLYTTLVLAAPANDWSKPCFNGECAYDVHPSTGNSGAIRMSGAAITDITPAAGWVILDCDPHSMEQEIRLVCSTANHEEAGCNHVFDNGGAEHKVVRLPESCSQAPFLRISSARVAEDQSIPHHAAHKITKRDGVNPTVHILSVDTNWAASDVSKVGAVTFNFIGTNTPDPEMMNLRPSASATKPSPAAASPQAHVSKRSSDGLFDWFSNAFNTIKDAVVHAAHTVANAVVNTYKNAVSSLKKLTSFEINPEFVKDVKLDTGGPDDRWVLTVSAGGTIDAHVKFGLTANGSVIPPQIGSYAVYAIVDGDVDVYIAVDATVIGHLETPRAKIIEVSISPLQIPGIISLGPYVKLEAQADLDLSLEVLINAHLKYKLEQLEFWYPKKLTEEDPEAKSGYKHLNLQPAPVTVEASAEIAAQANITAHLIPSLHIGLTALAGVASASGYIEVDAYAKLALQGHASIQAANHHHRELDSGLERRALSYVPPYLGARGLQAADEVTAQFSGCLGIHAGLVIRAGAQGTLGSLHGETPTWEIFRLHNEISILNICWPHAGKREISSAPKTSLQRRASDNGFQCGSGTRSHAQTAHTDAHVM